MFIYKITNILNNKIYIGKTEQTIEIRWKKHIINSRYRNTYFYRAFRKYGESNFRIEEIEKCNCINELNDREKYYIELYKSNNRKFGYNTQEGGTGGKQPPHILKIIGKKISKKNTGRKHTEKTKLKMSISSTGRRHTEETKKKIREIVIKSGHRPPINRMFGKGHPMYGKTHTPEARKKMSVSRLNKKYEDIFDKDTLIRLKNMHKDMWTGSNNPKFKHNVKIDLILEDLKNKMSVPSIAKKYNVSKQCIYYRLEKYKNGLV